MANNDITSIKLVICGQTTEVIDYNIDFEKVINIITGGANSDTRMTTFLVVVKGNIKSSTFLKWHLETDKRESGKLEFYTGGDSGKLIASIDITEALLADYSQSIDNKELVETLTLVPKKITWDSQTYERLS